MSKCNIALYSLNANSQKMTNGQTGLRTNTHPHSTVAYAYKLNISIPLQHLNNLYHRNLEKE